MFQAFKIRLVGTEEKKRLAGNIFSLWVLAGANYILPLLTLPYLVRVLGAEYFGLLAFATATITYFRLITDYGFNLSATQQISINRNNNEKINEIFSSVMIIKAALLIFSFFILCIVLFSFDKFSRNWEVYFLTYGTVIGQVLFPVWLFQGLEKMKFVTYLNISAKIFFTICVFILVKNKQDYYYVPLLSSLGFLFAGIWSLVLAKREFNLAFVWPSLKGIKYQLYEGWHIFFSNIAISLYTISATFFLGLFTNNIIVGYFSAADKIVQAIKSLYQAVSQSIFPLIGKKIHENKTAALAFVNKTTWIVGIGMFIISTLLFSLADSIINLLLGQQYHRSVLLLKIMSFLPFIIALSNMFGVQTMLNFGFKQAYSRILIIAATIGVGLTLVVVPVYEELGASLIVLFIEIFVTVSMFIYLKKNLIND